MTSLVDQIQGQTVHLRSLEPALAAWPFAVHPDLDKLRNHVQELLCRLFEPGKRLDHLLACDIALFAASWWPYAAYDRLCTATVMSLWMFAWDDETEAAQQQQPSLDKTTQLETGRLFREHTLDFVRQCLGLPIASSSSPSSSSSSSSSSNGPISPQNVFISAFEPVGRALVSSSSVHQRSLLMRELEFAVRMTDEEQRQQSSGELPSVAEYQRCRMGTSAVAALIAMTGYCYDFEPPPHIASSDAMRRLCEETNIIISTTNDILSLKKETAHGHFHSLIPLLMAERGMSLQAAIDAAADDVDAAAARFGDVQRSLASLSNGGVEEQEAVARLTRACQYACTANLRWSLCSARYGLNVESMGRGIDVRL